MVRFRTAGRSAFTRYGHDLYFGRRSEVLMAEGHSLPSITSECRTALLLCRLYPMPRQAFSNL